MSSSSSVECRGSTWSTMETFTLIELWGEEDVEKELSGVHRNRHVYEKLSYRMKEHGYLRAWDAIRDKLKSLRFGYMKAKQQNTTSGQERSKFPYFDQIGFFRNTTFDETRHFIQCWFRASG